MASPALFTNRGDKPFFLACISAALLASLIRLSTEKTFRIDVVFDGHTFFDVAFGPGCLASTTFSGQRQLFFPIDDNYS
jgi:hypothetical protein